MIKKELNKFKLNAFYPNAAVLNYSVETGVTLENFEQFFENNVLAAIK